MSVILLMAATLVAGGNPLLGTWVGEHAPATAAVATRSTMTITREAISFASGRREVGIAPISTFERDDRTLSVRTRFGDLYRFRFTGADRICRVADPAAPAVECFARSHA